jgi:hypothetical protein
VKLNHRRQSNPPGAGALPKVEFGDVLLPPRLMGFLLVLVTLMAYLPAFRAGFIWDDDLYVTNNPLLTAPDGWWRIWFSLDSPSQYFPLTYSVFRMEYALWGLLPAGYHWVNILLHTVNALLVWRVLERLHVPGAWLAAALFALHPVQVESVAWVTELKSVLSLFFMLLAVLAWLERIEGSDRSSCRWYLLVLACQALALTAKTTACTLPVALLLISWLKHQPITRRRLAELVPLLMMGAGMGLLAMWWERYHQGTQGTLFALGFPDRLLVAAHAVCFYLGTLLWPVHLTFSYPRWIINPGNPLAWGWVAAVVVLGAGIGWLRRRAGRGLEVAVLFFVLTLSPLLGFIMLYTFYYTFVADHYQYVACIGPLALAAAGLTKAFGLLGKSQRLFKPVLCGALLLTLGTLTWRQCGMYADPETLWQTTLRRNPGSWMAQVNLGEYLVRAGRVEEAVSCWRQALKLKPDDALAWYDLGVAASQAGQLKEAVGDYEKALEFEPDMVAADNKLAWVLATSPMPALRDGHRAVVYAERANRLTRGLNPGVLGTLAAAEAAAGYFPAAVAALQHALQLPAAQNDAVMLNDLQVQLKFYQANSLFRDLSLTNNSLAHP